MKLQDVDVVIIGLNSAKTIESCITSVRSSDYSQESVHIYYVDGGSIDDSVDLASSIDGVEVILLNREYPTPGSQRNAGWQKGSSPFVQFLDSDTEIHPKWISKAVKVLEDDSIGAVCGNRNEKYPERTVYNWIGDLEWNPQIGEVDEFGGDVCIKRDILEKSGGYNDNLIAGEDPELSHRIQLISKKLIRLDEEMTRHDLAMYTVKQYWKRAYRSGHAFAEINDLYKEFWAEQLKRIFIRGGGSVILSFLSLLLLPLNLFLAFSSALLCVSLLFRPRLQRVAYFQNNLNLSREEAKTYAVHASLVVIPQLFGVLRYYKGKKINKPLRNNKVQLRTGG